MVHAHHLSLTGEVAFLQDLAVVDVNLQDLDQGCKGGEDCSAHTFYAYSGSVVNEEVGDEEDGYFDVLALCAQLSDDGIPVY